VLAQTTPWWGIPVLTGVFTLVGVAIVQRVSYVNEKRKDRRRLEPEVRQLSATLLRLTDNALTLKLSKDPDRLGPIIEAATELQLIAPRQIARAASDLTMGITAILIDAKITVRDRVIDGDDVMEARTKLTNELRTWFDLEKLDKDEML
jgi:hypothetical protein